MISGASSLGPIFAWDARAGKLPVVKSSLLGNGHTSFVHTLVPFSHQGNQKLLSASVEGEIRIWDPSNMSLPEVPFSSVSCELQFCSKYAHGLQKSVAITSNLETSSSFREQTWSMGVKVILYYLDREVGRFVGSE